MASPKNTAVVQVALSLLAGPVIPYVAAGETRVGLDCQGLVELCVREAGGKISYAGSNDMFRNALTWRGTLAEANAQGKLLPGAALFILEADGKEPAKYKADGIGNASHVGLYLGEKSAEVVHASASKGCVCASTLKNAWTHVGLLKAVDYGTQEGGGIMAEKATIVAQSGTTVNMRDRPDGALVVRVPVGAEVTVSMRSGGWARASYGGYDGYIMESFLASGAGAAGYISVSAADLRYVAQVLGDAQDAIARWLKE